MLSSAILSSMFCFASAARHLSFTKAAEELHLTQSAVSHRIKKLEEQLGFKLFLRFNRRLQLTDQGQGLLAVLDSSLGDLDGAIRDLRQQEFTSSVRIAVPHSFARCWLAERLGDLHSKYPKMTLQVRAQSRTTDFQNEKVDVAVYYDTPARLHLHQQVLFGETLVPVCSKEYAEEHNLWQNPEALANCLLLHDESAWRGAANYDEWTYWAKEAGLTSLNVTHGFIFNRSDLAYRAAMSGQGVALGRWQMVAPQVEKGNLVVPIDAFVPSQQSYLTVCHPDRRDVPAIKAMFDWLAFQAEQSQELMMKHKQLLSFS
ncbi:DNA-binding transcriptional regulator DsdC [Ferrimonas lipolytica]|uniref:DNA-binding transcriptional regulator DsdC n=1 Tax=Ferrimonas lipolytica TaxID=2724191 RepID=A0A6H1UBE8_9GAMM|nr:DNA-binding transcriptional regulator DsdC [Ferrimonas lipolytica]QIZ76407.1 DNA-binding transcriptional regulator DsdC [Ferrimonas lipolytica]